MYNTRLRNRKGTQVHDVHSLWLIHVCRHHGHAGGVSLWWCSGLQRVFALRAILVVQRSTVILGASGSDMSGVSMGVLDLVPFCVCRGSQRDSCTTGCFGQRGTYWTTRSTASTL